MRACTTMWVGGGGGRSSNISERHPTQGAVLSRTPLPATPESQGALWSTAAQAAMQMTQKRPLDLISPSRALCKC